MDIRWIAIAAALPLAACSSSEAPVESTPAVPPAEAACNADAVQSLIGQTATADVGGQLLKGSGARTLRWVPPRTARSEEDTSELHSLMRITYAVYCLKKNK